MYLRRCKYLGKPPPPKTDEFSEKFRRGGGGSFPIQKFMLQNLDFWTGLFWHKNDTKGYFQGMFFNNLKRKISTGHIGKQDTFDPPPPLPLRKMSKNSFVLVGLPFPIFKRPVVFICCRTVSLHQAGDLTCWIAIFRFFRFGEGSWSWSWDFVFDSRDHYFWYSRTQGFSKIYHMYGF